MYLKAIITRTRQLVRGRFSVPSSETWIAICKIAQLETDPGGVELLQFQSDAPGVASHRG